MSSRKRTVDAYFDGFRASDHEAILALVSDEVVAPHLGEGRLRGGAVFKFAGVTVFGFDGDLISRVDSYIVPLQG